MKKIITTLVFGLLFAFVGFSQSANQQASPNLAHKLQNIPDKLPPAPETIILEVYTLDSRQVYTSTIPYTSDPNVISRHIKQESHLAAGLYLYKIKLQDDFPQEAVIPELAFASDKIVIQ